MDAPEQAGITAKLFRKPGKNGVCPSVCSIDAVRKGKAALFFLNFYKAERKETELFLQQRMRGRIRSSSMRQEKASSHGCFNSYGLKRLDAG